MRGRTKIIIGVASAVVIAVVVAAIVSSRNKGIQVRTAKVARKDLVQLVTANGTVQAKTKVELSANIACRRVTCWPSSTRPATPPL